MNEIAERYWIPTVTVDESYSSKTCVNCRLVNHTSSAETFRCDFCGSSGDRDGRACKLIAPRAYDARFLDPGGNALNLPALQLYGDERFYHTDEKHEFTYPHGFRKQYGDYYIFDNNALMPKPRP